MRVQRAQIVLPPDLLHEIDVVVGPGGRKKFIVDSARAELRRRRLLTFLESDEPGWRDEHHPELQEAGTAEWVRSMRRASDKRVPEEPAPQ